MDRPVGYEVVKELIQNDLAPDRLVAELNAVLAGGTRPDRQLAGYADVQEKTGGPGASKRAGMRMVEELQRVQ